MISNCAGRDQRWVLSTVAVRVYTMRVEYKKYLEFKVQGFVLECELPSTGRQARVTGMCCNAVGVYFKYSHGGAAAAPADLAPGADT